MVDKYKKVQKIDQIPSINYDRGALTQWISEQREHMITDRQQWEARHRKYLGQWDDYLTYNREGPWDDSANLHLPITMQMVKAVHARFKNALFSVRPWWQLIPLEKLDQQRIKTIDTTMRWAVQNYVNQYKGIEPVVDDWIWDFCTTGWGVLKRRWEIKQRKAIIVEEVQQNQQDILEQISFIEAMEKESGQKQEIFGEDGPRDEVVAKEVEKLLTYFDGPVIETIPHEDILFPGSIQDASDLDQPDLVCHDYVLDESALRSHAKSGFFDAEEVENIINGGLENTGAINDHTESAETKRQQDRFQGVRTVDATAGKDKAKMSECFARYDIDGDGIDEELVITYERKSRRIVRTTYLDRVTKTGKRPLHKIDFIRRPRRAYSIGMLELLFPINEELDAIHNMRTDFGTLTNIPFFFYRAPSGMKPEKIRIEPGLGYPLDDPQRDVNFPRWSNSTAWGFQEEAGLVSWAERLTSVTAMNSGVPSQRVGASRTASGMMALLNEANVNLDVMLGRLKNGYQGLLKGLLADLQERLPKETMVRVTGSDGKDIYDKDGNSWFTQPTRQDISGRLDLVLIANSTNSNRELEKQNAILYSQMLLNPINLQTGIVNPLNIYNLQKQILEKHGVHNPEDFITEPQMAIPPLNLYDEIAAITQGLVPRIVMNDDHQSKIQGLMNYSKEPAFLEGIQLGVNSPQSYEALDKAVELHQKYFDAMNAQAAQANTTGLQISPTMGARMAGVVGETGRSLPQENIPKGQIPKGQESVPQPDSRPSPDTKAQGGA